VGKITFQPNVVDRRKETETGPRDMSRAHMNGPRKS
jgi:hypothetical protein